MKKYVKPALCVAAGLVLVFCITRINAAAGSGDGKVTTLGAYRGLEITKTSVDVTDEELDTRIQSILDANPEYVDITDRAARLGDIVNIDFTGLKDGVAFEGGTSSGFELELGSHRFIDGFEDGLVGAKAGDEVSLDLTFPEGYHSEELAGQDVVFNVKINGIQEVREAVLDDGFVRRMSDFNTVEEFREDTKKDMVAEREKQAELQMQAEAMQAVTDASQFKLNQQAVDEQYEDQMDYLTSMVAMYGISLDDYGSMYGMTAEQLQEEMRAMAEASIKQKLVVAAIAKAENLQVDDADRQYVADQNGTTLDMMKENYAEELDEAAMAYKVVTFIIENAVVK